MNVIGIDGNSRLVLSQIQLRLIHSGVDDIQSFIQLRDVVVDDLVEIDVFLFTLRILLQHIINGLELKSEVCSGGRLPELLSLLPPVLLLRWAGVLVRCAGSMRWAAQCAQIDFGCSLFQN